MFIFIYVSEKAGCGNKKVGDWNIDCKDLSWAAGWWKWVLWWFPEEHGSSKPNGPEKVTAIELQSTDCAFQDSILMPYYSSQKSCFGKSVGSFQECNPDIGCPDGHWWPWWLLITALNVCNLCYLHSMASEAFQTFWPWNVRSDFESRVVPQRNWSSELVDAGRYW